MVLVFGWAAPWMKEAPVPCFRIVNLRPKMAATRVNWASAEIRTRDASVIEREHPSIE